MSFLNLKRTLHKILEAPLQLRNEIRVIKNRKFLEKAVADEIEVCPIFIIGPPRCGSTLLYQAMVHYFKFCFFTNEMMENPLALASYVRRKEPSIAYVSDFQSSYGLTAQPNAPHESWPFWRRFYPHGAHDYIHGQSLSESEILEIRRTIAFLTSHYHRPFVCKNIETTLRLQSLRQVFPNAVFIVVKRDPRATASSILRGREEHGGGRNNWMGMKPESYPELREKAIHEQIGNQILEAYRCFYDDVGVLAHTEIKYETFCKDPTHTLQAVEKFLARQGIVLERSSHQMPDHFTMKKTLVFTSQEQKDIEAFFEESEVFQTHLGFYMCDRYAENRSSDTRVQ